ncbi:MAG TPA: CHAT domain-containing protein, partial [Chroococcidiopsis sp.]
RELVRQGNQFRQAGQLSQAAAAYRAAIQLEPDYPPAHNNLGLILYELGDYDGAIAAFNRVLELNPLLVPAYGSIITVLTRQGFTDRALATYERAFTTVMNSGSDDPDVYVGLGRLMLNREDLRERAIPVFERAIALNPNLPTAYHDLGILLRQRERLEEAIAPLQRTVELSVGNQRFAQLLASACDSLGTIYMRLDRLSEQSSACGALSESASALDYVRQGRRLRGQNNLEAALAAYDQAIARDPNLAVAHNDRGVVLDELNRRDEAIAAFNRAIELQPNVSRYINLGNALLAAGRPEEALNAYLQIESVLTVLESLPEHVTNQDLLSALTSDSRGFEQYNDRAYFFATNQSYYGIYIDLLMQLHERYPDRGFDVRALQVSERARARSLLETLTTANTYQAIDDSQLAEQESALRAQIRDLVRQWTELGGSVRDFAPAPAPPVESGTNDAAVTDASVTSASVTDASVTSASADATATSASATSTSATDSSGITSAESASVAPSDAAASTENGSEVDPAVAQQQAAIAQQIQVLRQQYETVQAQIRERNPEFAQITQPPAITLAQIQQLLDNDTLLLEYWLSEEKSYLWVISRQGIQTYELPNRIAIEQAARAFYNTLTIPSERIQIVRGANAGRALSQMILAPIADQLDGQRLIVVPDGALHYIPFTALPLPVAADQSLPPITSSTLPDPLVTEHEIVNLPSASVLASIRRRFADRRSASRAIAVIADPVFGTDDERYPNPNPDTSSDSGPPIPGGDARGAGGRFLRLRGTGIEAAEIIHFADDEGYDYIALTGFEATRHAILENLSNFRIIHFATHGVLNDDNPGQSGLVLTQIDPQGVAQGDEGFLRMPDVFGLNLPADLVVLSACQTGLGSYLRGEGLLGLTQGFMYAGAERVVVSLWSVDDEATSILMERFYRGFVDKGQSPAEALTEAQQYLRETQDGRWRHPYYWSAFVLQGEWQR